MKTLERRSSVSIVGFEWVNGSWDVMINLKKHEITYFTGSGYSYVNNIKNYQTCYET